MKNEPEEDFPYYKLIFLGDQTVGKSSILNRFKNDTYTEDYQASIGLDFQSKIVQIDNKDTFKFIKGNSELKKSIFFYYKF